MQIDLRDKVALVTGGGSGIGADTAKAFARAGAQVAVLGRTPDELNECVADIKREGGKAMPILADISIPSEMEGAIETVIGAYQRLDIIFANAGINGVWAPIDDLTPEEWDATLDINLKGTFLTVKYALPYLKQRGGAIIITSSVNGTRMFSNTGATAYACSKAAQVTFAKMTALELAPHRVRVNVICPGAIESKIDENTEKRNVEGVKIPVEFPEGEIPLTNGKPGFGSQVADLVLFLASDAASHITGTEIWIDGGQSLLQG
jgi:NAD(P)-dependent dehydrogenase (short-subunit alcohol dehydrogenase family)